jgi:hypothetical protein
MAIIAVVGHDTVQGAHVPQAGEGHGSHNVVIHETMHAIDRARTPGEAVDPDFLMASDEDQANLPEYEQGSQIEEAYAESAARYYGGDSNDEQEHPNLHEYWETDPLQEDDTK